MRNAVENNTIQVVNFNVCDFNGSIDIHQLSKVIALPQLSATPAGPEYLIGLVNLAGKVIPVVDLSILLKMNRKPHYTINTPVMICSNQQCGLFGMIVDNIDDIAVVNKDMMQRDVSRPASKKYIIGAIKFDHGISLLINTDELIGDEVRIE